MNLIPEAQLLSSDILTAVSEQGAGRLTPQLPQSPQAGLAPFAPAEVRYIKLGRAGAWTQTAFDRGIIPFDCYNADHAACMAGDWTGIREVLLATAGRGAGNALRELREFYQLPEGTLWFTIADGRLRWALAGGPVQTAANQVSGQPQRWRQTVDGWHGDSLTGQPLTAANLSSALIKVGGYPKTICGTAQADYLLRRIRGEADPLVMKARVLKNDVASVTLEMIRRLQPDELRL